MGWSWPAGFEEVLGVGCPVTGYRNGYLDWKRNFVLVTVIGETEI
jgi:hypothetical protein